VFKPTIFLIGITRCNALLVNLAPRADLSARVNVGVKKIFSNTDDWRHFFGSEISVWIDGGNPDAMAKLSRTVKASGRADRTGLERQQREAESSDWATLAVY